jgi:hypothetical protein
MALCFALCLVLGCGKSKSAPAKVSGKVTYKGAAVTGGNVVFYTKDGGVYTCPLTPEGTYTGTQFPAGDCDVTVETESINPNVKKTEYTGGRGAGGGPASRSPGGKAPQMSPMPSDRPTVTPGVYVKIPAKYAKKDTSTLKATLTSGSNTKDFDLAD